MPESKLTKLSKREAEMRLLKAKHEIVYEYLTALKATKSVVVVVRKGFMQQLIRETKLSNGIPIDTNISTPTIYSRLQRDKTKIYGLGPELPMRLVEPQLVELIIRMSRIRICLTTSQCLHLANDIIKGTETENKVITYKERQFQKNMRKQIWEIDTGKALERGGTINLPINMDNNSH